MIRTTISTVKLMYKQGKLTPEQYIKQIIEKSIEDTSYNIWIELPTYERIKPYIDRLQSMNPDEYPLWGIPFAIKDNIDLVNIPTTAGCAAYTYIPEQNAEVVQALIDAGAIPLGKTNLDQFATGLVGVRSPYGETANAYRPDLISGGSSSGSAVAVARGHAVFSLGTDTAGSGRVPAALNKLVGYKPTIGHWSNKGVVPACASLDCVTVFANQLDDAYLVDAIIRKKRIASLSEVTSSALPERIVIPKEDLYFFGYYAEQYKKAWQATLARLEQMGVIIHYIDTTIFNEVTNLLYDGPWIAERWSDLGEFIRHNVDEIYPVTKQILQSAIENGYDAASVFTALHKLKAYKEEVTPLLEDAVLVMPTCGGSWSREQVRLQPIHTNSAMGYYTNHCNLLDLCALAIPSDDADDDLPFGITLFAARGNESYLQGTAKAFADTESVELAVCGLHMQGYALEKQMLDCDARFVRTDHTAPTYKMLRLKSEPAKPGLIRVDSKGHSIELEVWKIRLSKLGQFMRQIPQPLGIGKVTLQDGSTVNGFICESYIEGESEDISEFGGWRASQLTR
ncbi:allophanate hydrolase [Paenibacillus crassostreae]|uniref:Allophanate hydrolase n=1 Tax=Paenibacillus crassostreae TaxID=1763538 RepID=A0A167DTQ7_9BACL|nr:allophanate hydrolase [Paenibacillus crassostreae]AOZ91074.1 allophanate hydrolase [Paenibacillus crassostreae]OAB74765.1 allophanate hydrolase [Paenibacillus crassostreae]